MTTERTEQWNRPWTQVNRTLHLNQSSKHSPTKNDGRAALTSTSAVISLSTALSTAEGFTCELGKTSRRVRRASFWASLSVDICVADTTNEKHFMLAKANSLTCDTLTSAANALLLLHSLRPCLYILFILLPGLAHGNEGSAITHSHGAHRYLPELRGDGKYHR